MRVDIVGVPKGVPLIGGLTATVRIVELEDSGLGTRLSAVGIDVLTFFHLHPPRVRNCAQPDNATSSPVATLTFDKATTPISVEQIAPGLAPGDEPSAYQQAVVSTVEAGRPGT